MDWSNDEDKLMPVSETMLEVVVSCGLDDEEEEEDGFNGSYGALSVKVEDDCDSERKLEGVVVSSAVGCG